MKENKGPRVNEDIRAQKVRVIGDDGTQVGILSLREALEVAKERELDLIEIVPTANPPVCKLIDYGKYRYEIAKREKRQRKHQHVSLLKEIRFHPNTDVHDFEFKTRHAMNFLEEGHKVKASVVFKGREITYAEQGEDVLKRLTERLASVGKVDQPPKLEGRRLNMIFAPDKGGKKKTEQKKDETVH